MSDTTKGGDNSDPGIHRGTTAPVPPAGGSTSATTPKPADQSGDPGDPGIHRG